MRIFPLAVLVTVLALPIQAQTADPVERLAQALSLTADQTDLVAEIYDARDPASTWTLAAELLPTLTLEQRQTLLAPPERPADDDRVRGQRQGRRGQGGREGARRERDPAREAVVRAARDAALGLDAGQSARLDVVLEELDRRELAQAMRDGEMPESVAEILTADQAGLWQAQMALQRRLRMRGTRPSGS